MTVRELTFIEESRRMGKKVAEVTTEEKEMFYKHYDNIPKLRAIVNNCGEYNEAIYGVVYNGLFIDTHAHKTVHYDIECSKMLSENQDNIIKALSEYRRELISKLRKEMDWLTKESNLLEEGVHESMVVMYQDNKWCIYNIEGTQLN